MTGETAKATGAGKWWFVAMGLFLSLIGAGACGYLWLAFAKAKRMDGWVERPCSVLEASVADAGADRFGMPSFRLELRYRYEFEGAAFESGRVKRIGIAPSSKDKLGKWLERYPAGLETTCYVNPADPEVAVLKKDSKGAIYAIWFPALFFVGGLGIAAGGFRRG